MPTLELIIGSEGSGKTRELIRRLQQEQIENKKVFIFKPPAMDEKKSQKFEGRMRLPAIPVAKKMDLTCPTRKSQCDVIGIVECHLFEGDEWFLQAVTELLNKHPKNSEKLRIIIA